MPAGSAHPSDLVRFLTAQAGVFDKAWEELRAGRKRGHWMWFVFPQLTSPGHSPMALHYGLDYRAEAAAFLAHPILRPRLEVAVDAV